MKYCILFFVFSLNSCFSLGSDTLSNILEQDFKTLKKSEFVYPSNPKLQKQAELCSMLIAMNASIGNDTAAKHYWKIQSSLLRGQAGFNNHQTDSFIQVMSNHFVYVKGIILERINDINNNINSRKINDVAVVDSLIMESRLYSLWQDTSSAIQSANLALQESIDLQNYKVQGDAYFNLGRLLKTYSNKDFNKKCYDYLVMSIRYFLKCREYRKAFAANDELADRLITNKMQTRTVRKENGAWENVNKVKTEYCEKAFIEFEKKFRLEHDTILFLAAVNNLIAYYEAIGELDKCNKLLNRANEFSQGLLNARFNGHINDLVKLDTGYYKRREIAYLVKLGQQLRVQSNIALMIMQLANYRKTINNIIISALCLVLVFFYFAYFNYKKQKKANILLKETQAQLIHQEKMASIGQLTSGIAHEIQNPLNFVNNFSELSLEYLEEIKEAKCDNISPELLSDFEKNLTMINHHGKRADGIVKGMLMHSRAGKSEMQPTSINALCSDFVNLCIHSFRAKYQGFECEIKLDLDQSLPLLKIVPQDIGRVILNLINNALYSVKEKGKQGIKEYKPEIKIKTSSAPGLCKIEITDNGLGIPVDIKDKIFNPFFTTKPTGEGTGLGLSLSYEIAKAHKGNLTFSSEQDATRFILSLPMI